MDAKALDNIFTHHPPTESQVEKYIRIRSNIKIAAHTINDLCPDSREKSLAITKLQEASMMANAAIAINE